MSRSKRDLTNGPILSHMLRMSIPMTWGIFAIISFQLADLYFIGLLGTEPLAAISFTIPVTTIVFNVFLGLTIAMSSVLSRQIGEKNHDRVIRITTHGVSFSFLVGITLALIGIIFMTPIFGLMGIHDNLMPLVREYMHIWFIGNIFLSIPMVSNAAIRAHGNTMFPAIVMTTAALVNLILDPILIFGLLGFPELGIKGAAIASLIGDLCAMLAAIYMLGFRMKLLRFKPFYAHKFGDSLKRLLFIALPAGITSIVQPVTSAVIIGMLASYGAETVAAYGIVSRVEAFAFIVLMGLAGGMSPILGQNWGAKAYERVNETLRIALGFSFLWALGVAIVLFFFAEHIAGIFSDDPHIIEIARLYFWIVPISYITGNLIMGWSSAFNAIGMPQRSLIMIFGKNLLVLVPAVLIGNYLYGVNGIFCAIASVNLVLGFVFHLWNRQTCKKKQHEADLTKE